MYAVPNTQAAVMEKIRERSSHRRHSVVSNRSQLQSRFFLKHVSFFRHIFQFFKFDECHVVCDW